MSDSSVSKSRWIGRIISGLLGLFLLFDGLMKLVQPAPVLEATFHLGYDTGVVFGIGVLLIVCTLIYLVPRTSVLGAILLTGYFGGAVASHVRVSDGPFPLAFVFTFGVLTWVGLYLRDPRVRALFGPRPGTLDQGVRRG